MRPDEAAAQSEIERAYARDRNISRGVKTAASIGASVALPYAVGKILPFLSEHIPLDLAVKGISKVSPKFGEFLKQGASMGLDVKEGINFIKNQFSNEPAKENRNIIQQYSPELHDFIQEKVKSGQSILEAGARATMKPNFEKIIRKMEKDHRTPWTSILETIYGNNTESQKQQPQKNRNDAQQSTQQNNAPQEQGSGNNRLMAMLQQIQQLRGGQ